MNTITAPHDRLFRSAMADIRVAKEFFEQYLPTDIRAVIDFDSLMLCSNSLVDEALKLSLCDILYQATIAGEVAYIYLLCEHQSTPDPLMPFRLWQYTVEIWKNHLKKNGNKTKALPLIVPMVFYTGDTPYNASTDIREIIQASPKLIDQVLFQPFHLIDVNKIPDEELRENLWAGVMAFFMKHIRARDALRSLEEILEQLRQLMVIDGTNHIIRMLNYFLTASEIKDKKAFIELIQKGLSPAIGEQVMTLAEQFKAEGIQQGLQQGFHEGEAALLIRQLTRKFGALPGNYQERIKQADAEMLLVWGEQLLEAKTLAEVFH